MIVSWEITFSGQIFFCAGGGKSYSQFTIFFFVSASWAITLCVGNGVRGVILMVLSR